MWVLVFKSDGVLAPGGEDGTVRLWNVESDTPPVVFKAGNPVWCIAFHPQRPWVAAGVQTSPEQGSTVHIWDLSSRQEVRSLPHGDASVWTLAFSPQDAHLMATGAGDSKLRLWDIDTPQILKELVPEENGELWGVPFNRDGSMLASGGSTARYVYACSRF